MGEFEDLREDYSLNDLGGQLPNVGDIIVAPWTLKGKNNLDPTHRTFFEVTRRYFRPSYQEGGDCRVALEVLERPGKEEEVAIL